MRERLKELIRRFSLSFGDFVLASGERSHYYIDLRMTSLHPEGLALTSALLYEMLNPEVEAVGGMGLGAYPLVSGIVLESQRAGRPVRGFLIRKEKKPHGRGKKVEGWLEGGSKVALVEDVVTTGGSLLKAAEEVRAAGGKVIQVLAVLDRGGGSKINSFYPFSSIFTVDEIIGGENG